MQVLTTALPPPSPQVPSWLARLLGAMGRLRLRLRMGSHAALPPVRAQPCAFLRRPAARLEAALRPLLLQGALVALIYVFARHASAHDGAPPPPQQVVIALMSFPFLVFALPLVQDWVTHVKPTGYDRSGKYGD